MPSPTQKTSGQRDRLLIRMRDLVANNRDKIFKRGTDKSLPSGKTEQGEVVDDNVPF